MPAEQDPATAETTTEATSEAQAPDLSAAVEAAGTGYGSAEDAGDVIKTAGTGEAEAGAAEEAQPEATDDKANDAAEDEAPAGEGESRAGEDQLRKDVAAIAAFLAQDEAGTESTDAAPGAAGQGDGAQPSAPSLPSGEADAGKPAGKDAGEARAAAPAGVPDPAPVLAAIDKGLRDGGFPEVAESLKPLGELIAGQNKVVATALQQLRQSREIIAELSRDYVQRQDFATAETERAFEGLLKGLGDGAKDRYGVGVADKQRSTEQKKARANLRKTGQLLARLDADAGRTPDPADIARRAHGVLSGSATPAQAKAEVLDDVKRANRRLSTPPGIPGGGHKPAAQSREAAVAAASKFFKAT